MGLCSLFGNLVYQVGTAVGLRHTVQCKFFLFDGSVCQNVKLTENCYKIRTHFTQFYIFFADDIKYVHGTKTSSLKENGLLRARTIKK